MFTQTKEMNATEKWNNMSVMERFNIMQIVKKENSYKSLTKYQRACIQYIINNGI